MADRVATSAGRPVLFDDWIAWQSDAPAKVTAADAWGDDSQGWQAWSTYVARRPNPLPKRLRRSLASLGWGLSDELLRRDPSGGTLADLSASIDAIDGWRLAARKKKLRHELSEARDRILAAGQAWLEQPASLPTGQPSLAWLLEGLAWCHALPSLVGAMPASLWWSLLQTLSETAQDAQQLPFGQGGQPWSGLTPLLHQIGAVELAGALALNFPELQPCRSLAAPSRQAWERGLSELTDDAGLVHATLWPLWPALLACWTRTSWLAGDDGSDAGQACKLLRSRLEACAQNAVRRADGEGRWLEWGGLAAGAKERSSAATDDATSPVWMEMRDVIDAAVSAFGDRGLKAAWKAATDESRAKKVVKKRVARRLPALAVHGEEARGALLRSDWSCHASRVSVQYVGSGLALTLDDGRQALLAGELRSEIRLNGRLMQPDSDWDCLLFLSDDDVQYIELQRELDGGLIDQQQVLLGREDQFLFLARTVIAPPEQKTRLSLRQSLPIAPGVRFEPAAETHEGWLHGSYGPARILPLGLPEWRAANSLGSRVASGALGMSDGELTLQQDVAGAALYAPLFIDLRLGRQLQDCTWRSLTVAENLQIVAPATATAHRVQAGPDQWVFYRSIGPAGNRTFLGVNTCYEFYAARFARGEAEMLMAVE